VSAYILWQMYHIIVKILHGIVINFSGFVDFYIAIKLISNNIASMYS